MYRLNNAVYKLTLTFKTLCRRVQHELLFDWRIELWKAKALGVHTYVDTIKGGPLFGSFLGGGGVALTWTHD